MSVSSSTAVDDTLEEDLAWFDEYERNRAPQRALELEAEHASTDVHLDAVPTVAVCTLDRLPEVVLTEHDVSIGGSCLICHENFRVGDKRMSLPCLHLFHGECVRSWLGNSKDQCPVCRASVNAALGASASDCDQSAQGRSCLRGAAGLPEPSQEELQERRLRLRYRTS